MIETRTNLGSNAINIGAMNCYNGDYLDNHDNVIEEDEIPLTMGMFQDAMNGLGSEEDMNAFFASGVHGGPEVRVDARHLSKVWRISYKDAKRTINATTQHGTHHPNPVMNQNYTTMEGPTNVFYDNEAVFKNTSIPDSTLKKKHTSICYHRSREAVDARTMWVAKEGTATNLADLFTKPLMDSRRAFLLGRFTY